MYLFVVVLHVILCLLLVLIILLQPGKGGDVGAAFGGGGGGGGGVFGPRGPATLLSRATTAVAVTFMITSISLALMSGGSASDVDELLTEGEDPSAAGALDLRAGERDADDDGAEGDQD